MFALTGLLKNEDGTNKIVEYGYDLNSFVTDESYLADYENYEGGLEDTLEIWYTSKFTTDALKGKIKTDK